MKEVFSLVITVDTQGHTWQQAGQEMSKQTIELPELHAQPNQAYLDNRVCKLAEGSSPL